MKWLNLPWNQTWMVSANWQGKINKTFAHTRTHTGCFISIWVCFVRHFHIFCFMAWNSCAVTRWLSLCGALKVALTFAIWIPLTETSHSWATVCFWESNSRDKQQCASVKLQLKMLPLLIKKSWLAVECPLWVSLNGPKHFPPCLQFY